MSMALTKVHGWANLGLGAEKSASIVVFRQIRHFTDAAQMSAIPVNSSGSDHRVVDEFNGCSETLVTMPPWLLPLADGRGRDRRAGARRCRGRPPRTPHAGPRGVPRAW